MAWKENVVADKNLQYFKKAVLLDMLVQAC